MFPQNWHCRHLPGSAALCRQPRSLLSTSSINLGQLQSHQHDLSEILVSRWNPQMTLCILMSGHFRLMKLPDQWMCITWVASSRNIQNVKPQRFESPSLAPVFQQSQSAMSVKPIREHAGLFNKAAVQPSATAGESGDKKKGKRWKNIWIFGNYHKLDSRFLSRFFSLFYKDCILLSAAKIPWCNFLSVLFTFCFVPIG